MFEIQLGNPITTNSFNIEDTNLDEAIESTFPMKNEDACMIWNNISIQLSYKYDISIILVDILDMINKLQKEESVFVINWPSNTFSSTWEIFSHQKEIRIKSNWICVLGAEEALLNKNDVIEMDKEHFVKQWMPLLSLIKNKLEMAGYNKSNLRDFYLLEEVLANYL